MAREKRNSEKRGSGGFTEDQHKGRPNNGQYESKEYGDFDDGGYDDGDDDEEDDYAFESGYDDEDYADYDTSFDEDDASWGRRQEQFEGVTRDERRRKAQRGSGGGLRKRGTRDHSREFDEGYDSDKEHNFDKEYSSERGSVARPRRKVQRTPSKRRHTLRSLTRGGSRSSGSKRASSKNSVESKRSGSASSRNTRKTSPHGGVQKRSSSSNPLRTRSNGNGRKGLAGIGKTSRKRATPAKKRSR